MDIFDLILAPLYLIIILFIAHKFTINRKIKDPTYKYFMPGLIVKNFGAISLGLVYFYYYKGGDTMNYFWTASAFVDVLNENPEDFWHLYFGNPEASEFYMMNASQYECVYWVRDKYAFFVSKLFVPFVLIAFKSYMASSVIVATICYLGVWRLFRVFLNEFPQLHKQFRWSVLYVPSVIFWGSGIMKDSVTFSATCFYVHGFYWFFTQKRRNPKYIFSLLIGSFLLLAIKPYILFALLPGSVLWFASLRMAKIKNAFIRIMFTPALLAVGLSMGIYVLEQIGDSLGKYSLDKVIKTASIAQQDMKQDYYGGNSFNIGDYDADVAGMLSVAHKAIFATLFRPTFFDVQNFVMGICAIENTFIFGFCLYLLIKLKVYRFFGLITSHPLLMFSFIFSIFFAFSLGVSISNFGALVRLKIPCIPFFLSSMVILNEMVKQSAYKTLMKQTAHLSAHKKEAIVQN